MSSVSGGGECTVVWFRRDLRIEDNPALAAAVRAGRVIPVFIWAPEEEGHYHPGRVSRWWLKHSLAQLQTSLGSLGTSFITKRSSDSVTALIQVFKDTGATQLFFNNLYDPISLTRDHRAKQLLSDQGIVVQTFNADLLYEPWEINDDQGQPFNNFTEFWNRCLSMPYDPAAPMLPPKRIISDESARSVYIEFYMETNSICHQLQADSFKHETERLVNDLKKSAQFTEVKLEHIDERSNKILDHSKQIHNSLSSIDSRIDQVAQTSKEVEEQIDVVLNYSKIIFEQSKEIASSQSELQGGQVDLRDKLDAGVTMLEESYKNLGNEIEKLRSEAIEIEREIIEVSNTMSSKMQNLQNKADDIGNVAGISLDKQKQLLDGQSTALEGLDFLTKFQSQALEESRSTLEKLAEFGRKQQEELLRRQEQLQLAHDHLIENSRYILEAQEIFESKQANMFMALEKLFTLHNSILQESRTIRSLCFYFLAIIIVYMLTSTKQTYCVRARLYLGLCATFLAEFVIIRMGDDLDQQTWIASKIWLARLSFLLLASLQILFSIFTYRDYEVLNHKMLQSLMEKINTMERHKVCEEDTGSDISLSAWIDTELPEELVNDPDYYLLNEEVAENSVSTTSSSRKYNLRPRFR